MKMQKITKRLIMWAILVAAVLMIPLLGKFPWSGGDYIFAAVALFGSATIYELVSRKGGNTAYRVAVGIAVVTSLLLVWINGAVGIIGDGDLDIVNAMYFGVLAIGLLGAFITLLEARKMSYVLYSMATLQFLVPIVALIIYNPQITSWGEPGILGVFLLNTFFVIMYVGSGILFRHSSNAISKSTT